jgi:hypothetical protein
MTTYFWKTTIEIMGGFITLILVLLQLIKGVSFHKERMGDRKKENIQKRKKEK